ncbi:MAG: SufD family Fe-S cluster assembly protein [Erysipelotrichia bacterium]|nr:SufD family Fe-S cluster assembly protein [Erysipelotrichia bacterium]NCC53887.1 SufD family Fe-S cluster assembly protein [Erysipelotrichia bacterium]
MYVELRNSMIDIRLEKDGLYEYEYQIDTEETLKISVAENVHATCVLVFVGDQIQLHQQMILYSNSSLHILYRNECNTYESEEEAMLYENAYLHAGYLELNENCTRVKATYTLLEAQANVEVTTTTMATNEKHYQMACVHKHPYTYSNMEHYAINDKHGLLNIVASGKIEKGAKGSKSHQSTKVLTLAEEAKEKVSVTPLLLIDENDVEASHACGIGEMNEDHLYYLQTRGLDKRAALGLLTLSYLLPILRVVKQEEKIKHDLEEMIQCKVGLSC